MIRTGSLAKCPRCCGSGFVEAIGVHPDPEFPEYPCDLCERQCGHLEMPLEPGDVEHPEPNTWAALHEDEADRLGLLDYDPAAEAEAELLVRRVLIVDAAWRAFGPEGR
jgi:hypothetical protein